MSRKLSKSVELDFVQRRTIIFGIVQTLPSEKQQDWQTKMRIGDINRLLDYEEIDEHFVNIEQIRQEEILKASKEGKLYRGLDDTVRRGESRLFEFRKGQWLTIKNRLGKAGYDALSPADIEHTLPVFGLKADPDKLYADLEKDEGWEEADQPDNGKVEKELSV